PVKAREVAARNYLAVHLLSQGIHNVVSAKQRRGQEGFIESTISIESSQVIAHLTDGVGEGAAYDDPAVRLHQDSPHRTIQTSARIEGEIERAIGIEARQTAAQRSVNAGEIAADQDPAIGLLGQGVDRSVNAGARVEGHIQRAVGVQTHDAGMDDTIEAAKSTAHEHFAIRLE